MLARVPVGAAGGGRALAGVVTGAGAYSCFLYCHENLPLVLLLRAAVSGTLRRDSASKL